MEISFILWLKYSESDDLEYVLLSHDSDLHRMDLQEPKLIVLPFLARISARIFWICTQFWIGVLVRHQNNSFFIKFPRSITIPVCLKSQRKRAKWRVRGAKKTSVPNWTAPKRKLPFQIERHCRIIGLYAAMSGSEPKKRQDSIIAFFLPM